MEYQTSSSVALSQKLSTGHSIYDGVFTSAPSKFTVSSFSSRLEDYSEIFGSGAASSIPVLEVPELNDRRVEARSSKLDYSNVFGDFGDSDFAVPYEELFAEPKKKPKLQKESRRQGERVLPPKEAKRSDKNIDLRNEEAYESIDGVKKFSMSYNQSTNRSKSFAGVHSVPAYTCLVDETSPLRGSDGDKAVSMSSIAKERRMEGNRSARGLRDQAAGDVGKEASGGGVVLAQNSSNWKNSIDELFNSSKTGQGADPASIPSVSSQVSEGEKPVSKVVNDASSVNGVERKVEVNHHQAIDASKQTNGGVAKVQNSSKWRSSGSIDKFFCSGELVQETCSSNTPPLRSEGKGEFEKPVASMLHGWNRETFEVADGVSSPAYFDEEVDIDSVTAASVAALAKAIEEAQASIQMAKELMDRKKVGPQYRVKQSFDNSVKPKSKNGGRFADQASISEEAKTRELSDKVDVPFHVSTGPEQATPVFQDAYIMNDVMITGDEVHRKEMADNASIFSKKKTQELQEVHVSTVPEQVTVALDSEGHVSGVKETQEKVHVQEFKPTSIDDRHEEADDSEAAEQFYEFADTSEQDVSDSAEQFYEFADSSEPDVPEATEEFYEFADSNEHHNIILENQEANNTRQMFPSVDEFEQEKKTNSEAFETPEQVGKTFEAATAEEQREVKKKNIFNVVGEDSKFEENEIELRSSEEGSDQDDNEKLQEGTREHEETRKLTTTHIKEFCEEKQNGDDKRFETQELQETEHVKIKLVDQEWVESEKIDREACVLEENEREQAYARREEDTVRSRDEDNNEEIIETGNDCYDKKDFENRIKDDSKSEGNENLQDTRTNEEILEDESTSEGNEKLQDTRPNEKILEDDSKSEGKEMLQDTGSNEKIVEEAICPNECVNFQEESFKFIETGRMPVQENQEDQNNLECNFEASDNLYEQDVSADLNGKQGSARHVDCNQDEETPKLPTNKKDVGVKEVAETLIQLEENERQTQLVEEENGMAVKEVAETLIQLEENEHQTQLVEEGNDMAEKEVETLIQLKENENQTELVEEENGMAEKETCETDGLTPGVKLPEKLKQMEDATEIHSFEEIEISTSENDMSFVQKQGDQLAGEAESDFNVGRQVEVCEESGDINSDMIGAEVSVNQERNKNGSKSRKRWFGTNEVSEPFIKLEEDGNQSESIEDEDVMEEKVICEMEGLASGVKLAEILKQMEDVIEIHSSDTDGTSVYGQKQDAHLSREPVGACNLGKHVEEIEDINKDVMRPEVSAVNQEESMNTTRSSHRKRWFDNGNDTKVAQAPHIFARKAGSVLLDNETDTRTDEDSQQATVRLRESEATLLAEKNETNYTSQKEVEQEKEKKKESQTANDFEVSPSSQKEAEMEKEHLIQKAERRRERERQKEKRAVERAIREARERSFADVKERVAESRQKVMAEAQGRLGKTTVQANDTSSLAEKASKEAKQKWERAAVERAHAEARDRALEKALAEKEKRSVSDKYSGASPDAKQAKRSVSERFSVAGASRDNGANRSLDLESKGSSPSSTSRSPNSSLQSDPSPAERPSGTNGESAQRCKAILERNQRTAERAAKALAEKNNRDLLVQQEQAQRNRLAEVLDAEVKRWSSGKERNLRALLSTLQYILGPDSGWQPVHLTDIVTAVAVKKAYRKAALFVHPDKLQQRGASIQQKYTCEKVFDLLKDAWNRFSMEEQQR